MKIQGNLIDNYSYGKSDKNRKTVKGEEKKAVAENESIREEGKAEAARNKKEALLVAAEEMKKAAEEAKEQAEANSKEARRFGAILEIFRRIARGDKVSPKDESALMEYDMKLYISAKSAAMIANSKKVKKYKKSLIEELEKADKEKELKKAENSEKEKASEKKSKAGNTEKSSAGGRDRLGVSFDLSV